MGWAARSNPVAIAAKAGFMKPREKKPSAKARRDAAIGKVPLLAMIDAMLGVSPPKPKSA